jgi:hypothetical protein
MHRPIKTISLLLLSSAAITLAVAWSCVWWRPAPGGANRTPSMWKQPDRTAWMGPGQRALGWTEITLYGTTGLTATPLPAWIDPPSEGPLRDRAVHVVGAGWPVRCLQARIVGLADYSAGPGPYTTGLGPQRVHWNGWEHAIVLDDSPAIASLHGVLPHGLIARGLILNLLFWSLPGLALVALLRVRRLFRTRQSRCAACGYDTKGLPADTACPECGHHTTSGSSVRS